MSYLVGQLLIYIYINTHTYIWCNELVVNLCVLDSYTEGVQHQINHLVTLKAKDQDTDSTYNSHVPTLGI